MLRIHNSIEHYEGLREQEKESEENKREENYTEVEMKIEGRKIQELESLDKAR